MARRMKEVRNRDKQVWGILVLLVVCFFFWFRHAQSKAGTFVLDLADGGFEQSPGEWHWFDSPDHPPIDTKDIVPRVEGGMCLIVREDPEAKELLYYVDAEGVSALRVSVQVKRDTPERRVSMFIASHGEKKTTYRRYISSDRSIIKATSDGWQTLEAEFAKPPEVDWAEISITISGGTGNVYLDDLVVTVDRPGPALLGWL